MVVGCGIDTEERNRFQKHLKSYPSSPFVEMLLSDAEKQNYLQHGTDTCFPLSFCCKEATFKALGESWTTAPIDWKDIELLFHHTPAQCHYAIQLKGYAASLWQQLGTPSIRSHYIIHPAYVSFEIILHHEKCT